MIRLKFAQRLDKEEKQPVLRDDIAPPHSDFRRFHRHAFDACKAANGCISSTRSLMEPATEVAARVPFGQVLKPPSPPARTIFWRLASSALLQVGVRVRAGELCGQRPSSRDFNRWLFAGDFRISGASARVRRRRGFACLWCVCRSERWAPGQSPVRLRRSEL